MGQLLNFIDDARTHEYKISMLLRWDFQSTRC